MPEDLFSSAVRSRLRSQAPLAARLRPRSLDEVVGQRHLVAPGAPLRVLIEADRLTSVIFWGPAGTGKTTLAEVIALTTQSAFERISAVNAGVKDIREMIDRSIERLGQHSRATIVFIDEIHRFSTSQQDALLPSVESGIITLIGATTENPFFSINSPLRSRSTLFHFEPLDADAIRQLIERGVAAEGVVAESEDLALLVDRCAGDGRQALTALELASALAKPNIVTVEHVHHFRSVRSVTVAMITTTWCRRSSKVFVAAMSMPGCSGWHECWRPGMTRCARRLVILASETWLADPQALSAVAAARIGPCRITGAQLNLAQAVVYLHRTKKQFCRHEIWGAGKIFGVVWQSRFQPNFVCSLFGNQTGYGTEYQYPHDDPRGWVDQLFAKSGRRHCYSPRFLLSSISRLGD